MKMYTRRRSRMPHASRVSASDTAPVPEPEPSGRDLHVLADRPVDIHFSFEQRQSRVGVGASVLAHATMVLIAILFVRYVPEPEAAAPPPVSLNKLIWLVAEGPGGGGGGGGNKTPEPPRKAELPGKEKLTVPVQKPPELEKPQPKKEEPPVEQDLNIPVKALASAEQQLVGAIDSANPSTASLGTGDRGGAGGGTGTGVGDGRGSGLGPGEGGGTGGGVYRPGSGITSPRVVREVKPQYTADAMRAKVQGVVLLECVVMPDGTVGDVRVSRSLDPIFGLDQEAAKAARQWRFMPGTKQGEPVPVLVTIELTFTLR
jgi:periplasmic protein TonB